MIVMHLAGLAMQSVLHDSPPYSVLSLPVGYQPAALDRSQTPVWSITVWQIVLTTQPIYYPFQFYCTVSALLQFYFYCSVIIFTSCTHYADNVRISTIVTTNSNNYFMEIFVLRIQWSSLSPKVSEMAYLYYCINILVLSLFIYQNTA